MHYLNETDETLVMLTLAGEQRAYEALVTRYQKTVVAAAFSVTRTHFMAEDAAQDAFVTAWMKLDTLQAPAKFGAWVCRIAGNCARNMIDRYRAFLPLDVVDNLAVSHGRVQNPAEMLELSEDKREVSDSVAALPEKVREIIRLHYYEDLSVAEIADRLRLSAGTVKWQLHEGRKKIRKELCALNEKYSDSLKQRVMKKVEELKLWQLKNDKSGFDTVYKEVLREVEELPECREKQHALADVLMRGWWWLPGKKNDALFARIAEAAMAGKNEEVMTFIVTREDSKLSGSARIEFIRDKQIPQLEKAGFVKALGREWFWLGYDLFRAGKAEEGEAAYTRVEAILDRGELYRVLVPYARELERLLKTRYQNTLDTRYEVGCLAQEYRIMDGELRYWSEEGIGEGRMHFLDRDGENILRNASRCDGRFFAPLAPGESFTGSDGTLLSLLTVGETVNTPAGTFEDCQLWETKRQSSAGKTICRSWYKERVGIVRQDHLDDGWTATVLLSGYDIKGGDGLLPLHAGNSWTYVIDGSAETVTSEITLTVQLTDSRRAVVSSWFSIQRHHYNEDSWIDMIQQMTQEYYRYDENGNTVLQDVTSAIERAKRLAVTPLEKAHTQAAAAVAARILATDRDFSPNCTATGHWNFFQRSLVLKSKDSIRLSDYSGRWHFEWKNTGSLGDAEYAILFNDILGILQDATTAVWSDEWRIGASPIVEYTKYSNEIRTQISCEDGGSITTKAGTFENCLMLRIDTDGMNPSLSYRNGRKAYWFAVGVGIVRAEFEYCGGGRTAVYELTACEGTGIGYMPFADGFKRKYEAIGLTDGFVGAVEYSYVADDDGDIVVFADRTGIRELPPPITLYSSIQGEVMEERLWDEWKLSESRLRHDVNNLHILCHFLGRYARYWGMPERSVEWHRFRMKIMEGLGDGGNVPEAWLGPYASATFRLACALFGCWKKEEGYEWLEKAFEAFPQWDAIPDGTEMDAGNPWVFGGVRVIKGRSLVMLPDGTKEPMSHIELFNENGNLMVYGMTATRGWEWFDTVRNEDRFRAYVERAKKLAEK